MSAASASRNLERHPDADERKENQKEVGVIDIHT
jgi:hypothetical protein